MFFSLQDQVGGWGGKGQRECCTVMGIKKAGCGAPLDGLYEKIATSGLLRVALGQLGGYDGHGSYIDVVLDGHVFLFAEAFV